MIPTYQQLKQALEETSKHVHKTPVLQSRLLDKACNAKVYLKAENFQKMGAFKMRGASYAISCLSKAQKKKGVATHSSGNFAQAVSLAAAVQGINAYLVMPQNAPEVKKAAVIDYGGKVIESGNAVLDREKMLEEVLVKTGATFVHPSNDMNVILGNGSAAAELIEAIPQLDMVLCPVGGGGLLAGTALAVHYFASGTLCYGVEPKNADDAHRSFHSGTIQPSINPDTIADGLRTCLGDRNFPIIQSFVEDIILVSEEEIKHALRFVMERLKIVIEPSSAVAVAGVLNNPDLVANKNIGIILSGGNVDLLQLSSLLC